MPGSFLLFVLWYKNFKPLGDWQQILSFPDIIGDPLEIGEGAEKKNKNKNKKPPLTPEGREGIPLGPDY